MDDEKNKNLNAESFEESRPHGPHTHRNYAWPYLAMLFIVLGGAAWLVASRGSFDRLGKPSSDELADDSNASVQTEDHQAQQVAWLNDYDEAIAQAKKLDRPVLIDFATSWCAPCVMMDKHVWPKSAVQEALASKVVPLRIDLDVKSARPVIDKYNVEFVPTILLIDAQGKELKREGFVDDTQLVEMIKSVM